MYYNAVIYIFMLRFFSLKIPVELPKQSSTKEKRQYLLHAIGCGCYVTKLSQKLPPLRKIRLRKKPQEKKDEIKIKLHKANQACNDWKCQIHWNKLECVNPRIHDEKKSSLCVF